MYEKIMNLYSTVGNYLVISLYDAYDVPREGTDGFSQGESEEVFRYIYTCICPVNLAKAALSYHEDENVFAARIRDWVVEMPDVGFLYPAGFRMTVPGNAESPEAVSASGRLSPWYHPNSHPP